LDEMWSPVIAAQLRLRGYDVEAVAATDHLRRRPDDIIFTAAQTAGQTIVTENVEDYQELAANALGSGLEHCGLVFTSYRRFSRRDPRTVGRMVTALELLLRSHRTLENTEYWLTREPQPRTPHP